MSEKDGSIKLVPGRSDVQVAEEFKAKFHEASRPLLEVIQEINGGGFLVTFGLDRDGFGRLKFNVKLMKEF